MALEFLNPESLGPRPRGYSNGVLGTGRILCIAGQIGWDERERLVSPEFVPQFRRALWNLREVLRAAGGDPSMLARITIYVVDKRQYLAGAKQVGEAWREILGKHFPAMSLVQVADLLEEGALVEVEATAILPLDSEPRS
ncbi:MAG: RidA family protein [Planctomycetes bacterium]|nr:RidA family protein [Planctomycetota bacterium]